MGKGTTHEEPVDSHAEVEAKSSPEPRVVIGCSGQSATLEVVVSPLAPDRTNSAQPASRSRTVTSNAVKAIDEARTKAERKKCSERAVDNPQECQASAFQIVRYARASTMLSITYSSSRLADTFRGEEEVQTNQPTVSVKQRQRRALATPTAWTSDT